MKKATIVKKAVVAALLCVPLALCGCSSKTNKDVTPDDSNVIYVSDTSVKPLQSDLVERSSVSDVKAPEGSISFEKACELIDTCGIEQFYVGQSLKDHKKANLGIIDYKGEKYYSIYPCVETNGKTILMGTHCLVSCNGSNVLTQNWMGGYETAQQGTAEMDKDWKIRCPDAVISPNDAISFLAAKEKGLGLEKGITEYVFEVDMTLTDINGLPCYTYTPKLEYTDHIELLGGIYVSADGKGHVFKNVPGEAREYSEIE